MILKKKIKDMTGTKRKYVKPQMTVIEVDMQQMICTSPGGENQTFSRKRADTEYDYYEGEFE